MSLKILVIAHADPSGNPRPRRIIELFKNNGHVVDVASYRLEGRLTFDSHYEIKRPSLSIVQKILRKFMGLLVLLAPSSAIKGRLNDLRWGYRALEEKILSKKYDVIVVEDIYPLPFAFRVGQGARIVFDAREFYPEELGNGLLWRLTERPMRMEICRKYLSQCDLVMTVSEGLALRYENDFGVKPVLLRSIPSYKALTPSVMQNGKIRLVHHGIANMDRRLENLVDIMGLLDERFELDFYLTGEDSYISTLKFRAEKNPRIRFFKPVPFEKIIPTLNAYDLGFCYIEPTTFNLEQCLPNKFFEFIQARLGLIIGPSEQMMPLVSHYECGFISSSFDTQKTAAYLSSLNENDVRKAKDASHIAAAELCYENESKKILDLISRHMVAR